MINMDLGGCCHYLIHYCSRRIFADVDKRHILFYFGCLLTPNSMEFMGLFVRGINRSTVNSPHKDQWRGALMFSLICAWINGLVNNREAGDLRRHHALYDVTVMIHLVLVKHPGFNAYEGFISSTPLAHSNLNQQIMMNNAKIPQ